MVAPSSPYPEARLNAGMERLTQSGFVVETVPNVLRRSHAYLNGTDDERLADLHNAFASDVDAIWLARGGYGLGRIVSKLRLPPGDLPTVIGFSDATALLSKLLTLGVGGVHGPLATTIGSEPDDSYAHALAVLQQQADGRFLRGTLHGASISSRGVEGWLYAANLCVLSHLVGTASLPSLRGAIVVIEEIGERPYRLDRMLTHLLDAGVLDGVAAVCVGHLTGCEEPAGSAIAAPTPLDVILERLGHLPVVTGLAVGHVAPNFALPLGTAAHIVPATDGTAKLILGPAPTELTT